MHYHNRLSLNWIFSYVADPHNEVDGHFFSLVMDSMTNQFLCNYKEN